MRWTEELASGLLEIVPEAVVGCERDGRIVLANAAACAMFGTSALVGATLDELIVPEERPWHATARTGGEATAVRALRADGAVFTAELVVRAVQDHLFVLARDVGRRFGTDQAQSLLASIVQSSHDAIVATDLDGIVLSWNPGAERLYGYRAAEMIGRSKDCIIPEGRRVDEVEIRQIVAAGGRVDSYRTQRQRSDGSVLTVSMLVSPLTGPDGATIGVTTTTRDISERERAEAQMQAVIDAGPDALLGIDEDDRVVLVNTKAERLFGYARYDLVHMPAEHLMPPGATVPGWDGPVARHRDGTVVPVDITRSRLRTDEGVIALAGLRDVTEQLTARAEQERLRAEADRQTNEVRLQRTQRLESLGQLAGGVAHDFNNLLAVINNYAEFIIEDGAGTPLAEDAEQILRAGQRGSDLTHQLLAFARREVIRPRPLDVNTVITEVKQMLTRSIGEHIALTTDLAADLPSVVADPGQLEQVMVNLAVNARDAMPEGGRLAIDTGLVTIDDEHVVAREGFRPGRYVRVRVSDTGTGMPAEVQEKAFEPFFTTKPSGAGTGLGLATVYGIVVQAGGAVRLYSEPGVGTTVSILLPASDAAPLPAGPGAAPAHAAGCGQTVLVAEDEPALREVTTRILGRGGYTVLAAADGAEALEVAAGHDGHIDLLLSDVVMPGMLGRVLAERLQQARPDTRVLFMSGYAQPVLTSNGILDPGVHLLEKPFTGTDLLAAVADQLVG